MHSGGDCISFERAANYSVLQSSVIRQHVLANSATVDNCVLLLTGNDNTDPEFQDLRGVKILQNEIYDCSADGIQLADGKNGNIGSTRQGHRGLIIDGNEIYLTPAAYVRCGGGALSRTGECACAENAVDIKEGVDPDVGNPTNAQRTRVSNNIFYGFRKTDSGNSLCARNSSHGYAVTIHERKSDFIDVHGNIFFDLDDGLHLEEDADNNRIIGNLFYDIANSPQSNRGVVELNGANDSMSSFEANLVMNSDRYLRTGNRKGLVSMRYNIFVNAGRPAIVGGGFSQGSTVGMNSYYNTERYNGRGDIGQDLVDQPAVANDSGTYCVGLKIHTDPRPADRQCRLNDASDINCACFEGIPMRRRPKAPQLRLRVN